MSLRRRTTAIATALLMMVSAAACGQKDGVADQAAGLTGLPAGAVIDPETGRSSTRKRAS